MDDIDKYLWGNDGKDDTWKAGLVSLCKMLCGTSKDRRKAVRLIRDAVAGSDELTQAGWYRLMVLGHETIEKDRRQ